MFEEYMNRLYSPEWYEHFPEAKLIIEDFIRLCLKLQKCPESRQMNEEYGFPWRERKFEIYFGPRLAVYCRMGMILEAEKPLYGFLSFCAEHNRIPLPKDKAEDFNFGMELAVRGWQVKYLAGVVGMDAEAAAKYVKEYKKQSEVHRTLSISSNEGNARSRTIKNIVDYKQKQLIYKGYSFYLTHKRLPEKSRQIVKYFASYDSFVKTVLDRINADQTGGKIEAGN